MDPVTALNSLGRAARLGELKEAGVASRALGRAVATQRIVRPLYGCYALPNATRADILRAAYRAELCCTSLCEALKLPVIERDGAIHLVVPRDRGRRVDDRRPRKGVVLHRHGEEVVSDEARVAVALDMLGVCADRMQQLVAIDAALNQRLMTIGDLAAFEITDEARLQWLRDHADPAADSLLETITRVGLVDEGWRVRSQVPIADAGRVDLLVEDKVVVQTDGREHHDNPVAFVEDRRRDRACVAAGYRVLRFTYDDVMSAMPRVIRDVRAALAY
ncbi:DUF559 domain-containing protein [Demequina sp. SYSU T00192]|uniref:DUF559 domain-containing protein n=1 Tax=Demequina litoralis TaxID=3051660 RepID=A0ABT8G8I0_9MICO|nr:DUF559 domain-containing protein [Demequina sp. SYSU T00192]MDN4475453.1 DUF559 domain-containing protein [Demequina sp. SYSU T00192]